MAKLLSVAVIVLPCAQGGWTSIPFLTKTLCFVNAPRAAAIDRPNMS
ncbi:hypothetical protein [Pseudooceanicola sp. LIPI14-2-Ac024]